MPVYIVSQGEHWFRNYHIKAKDLVGAVEIYNLYAMKGLKDSRIFTIDEPEFLNDIEDDVVFYDENGEVVYQ